MTGAGSERPAGLARIRTFVTDYHADDGKRAIGPAEGRLIENALIEYVLGEEWFAESVADTVTAARRALAAITESMPATGRPALLLIEQVVVDLAARLARREDANLIMREHLVTLSETNRQLTERLAAVSHPNPEEKTP